MAEQVNEDSNDDDDKWIFCSDLDEIEIALPKDDSGGYELVFNQGPYTYHHHARHDQWSSSKKVHKEKEKVHDGAKEVHWKCIQEKKRKERHLW